MVDEEGVEPPLGTFVAVGGNLGDVEGHGKVAPVGPPVADERFLQLGIVHPGTAVSFALIPDKAFGRKSLDRANHTVVKDGGGVGTAAAGFVLGPLARRGIDGGAAHPGLYDRATPIAGDQAYGNTQHAAEFAAEEVGHGGECAHGQRCGQAPGGVAVEDRGIGGAARHSEHADVGILVRLKRCLYASLNRL